MLDTIHYALEVIDQLKNRNGTLFFFGFACFALAGMCLFLVNASSTSVAEVNAWHKPLKFSVSIAVYVWTIGWFLQYLPSFDSTFFSWTNVLLFTFELTYITLQAARGQESHFNQSSTLYSALFVAMAVAATFIVLYAAYIAYLFFRSDFPDLSAHYLWSIRLALIIFVTFSLEGFLMGSRQSHTVGPPRSSISLPITKWNLDSGDLRVAHFLGMHALQLLPLLSHFVLKNTKAVFVVSAIYFLLATITLVQALAGKPVFDLSGK